MLIPMMEKQGYDRDFSVNVTVTSACQSMIIPPSHNMIIFALAAGGLSTGKMFLAVICAANGFCWIMSYLKIPALITETLLSISSNKYVLLVLINIFLLVLGCIMDVAPLIVITTPVLLPVITQIGMNPIQFGMMMLCNLAIGMYTPSVGATLFAGCAVGKIPMEKCMKGLLPFYLAMLAVVLLVTYVPAVSLTLPTLLMGA